MQGAWIEHLPWLLALLATLAALELLRRLRRAESVIHILEHERNQISLSLDLVQAVGQIGSWQYARDQNSAFWSDEIFAIHGRDRQRGQPPLDEAINYYHPEDRAMVRQYVQRSLDLGEDFDFRGRIITDQGVQKDVIARSTCQFDRGGRTIGVIGFLIDLGPSS